MASPTPDRTLSGPLTFLPFQVPSGNDLDLSILIPTCERPQALTSCVMAISNSLSSMNGVQCEVLIGDDGFRQINPLKVAPIPPAEIILVSGPRRGPAANRNALAARARGQLLIFLDDDCIPASDLVAQYLRVCYEHPDVQIFEGKIIADRQARFAYEEAPVNETGGYLWSANFAIRRHAFHELGGFDEDFVYAAMEDVDFRLRAIKVGLKIMWCADAIVVHPLEVRVGGSRLMKHRFSVLLFLLKHPERLQAVKENYGLRAALRLVKQRIFERAWIQPLASYFALASQLQSLIAMNQILKHPDSISREMESLREKLTSTT